MQAALSGQFASGDQGVLLKLELQKELGYGWQAVAFYDAGRIEQHKRPWAGWNGASGQRNTYGLQGAGLGVNWRTQDWQLAASVAAPIGGNRGSANGRNSDGSKSSSVRGWISLTRLF